MSAELKYIFALWQLCYISRGHRKLDITWFSNAHETKTLREVVSKSFIRLTNKLFQITWKRQVMLSRRVVSLPSSTYYW